MPKIVKVMEWSEINIDASVGRCGVNNKDDVMVVQALMKYALEERGHFKEDFFTLPTGIMDGNTLRLIEKYQRYLRRVRDIKVSVDGRIDPSNGLYVRDRSKLTWTICQLNGDALEMKLLTNKGGGIDYIQGIRQTFPQVDAILSGTAVGSLNLALE